jgi:hypothetical protein
MGENGTGRQPLGASFRQYCHPTDTLIQKDFDFKDGF